MKIAYRIITPILSLGAIAMGLLLKLFYFAIGGLTDEITSIVTIAQQFGLQTQYEFSAIEIIQMLLGVEPAAEEGAVDLLTIAEPILPHLITFIIFFVLALVMMLVVGIVAAATNKRKTVIGLCGGGLVILFICIVVARLAFDKIMAGDIKLTDLVGAFSDSSWAQIAAAVVKVSTAILSAGFYAVFGMYILIIIWTILANMLIKTPIQLEKKHRRKKPLKRPSAYFHR